MDRCPVVFRTCRSQGRDKMGHGQTQPNRRTTVPRTFRSIRLVAAESRPFSTATPRRPLAPRALGDVRVIVPVGDDASANSAKQIAAQCGRRGFEKKKAGHRFSAATCPSADGSRCPQAVIMLRSLLPAKSIFSVGTNDFNAVPASPLIVQRIPLPMLYQ